MKLNLIQSNVCKCYCHTIGYMGESYCNCCKLVGKPYINCDDTIDEDMYVRELLIKMREYRKEFKKQFNIEFYRNSGK